MKFSFSIIGLVFIAACTSNGNSNVNLNSEKELIQSKIDAIPINEANFKNEVKALEKEVKDGDIIVRSADNIESNYLKDFSETDKTFSHAGIAFIEDGAVYVYNVAGGFINPKREMLRDTFFNFSYTKDPSRSGCGIYRYPSLNNIELEALKLQTLKWYDEKLKFDSAFNIKDDNYMYCSEMIAKGLRNATNGRIIIPFTSKLQPKLRVPWATDVRNAPRFDYYAMDNIYVNQWATEVKRVMLNNKSPKL